MNSSKRSVTSGLASLRPRQRRDFGRIVDDEGRLHQLGFGGLSNSRSCSEPRPPGFTRYAEIPDLLRMSQAASASSAG